MPLILVAWNLARTSCARCSAPALALTQPTVRALRRWSPLLITVLLAEGARADAANNVSFMPLHRAAHRGHVARALARGGGALHQPTPRARGDAPSCPFPLLHSGDNDQADATLTGVPPLAGPRRAHQDPDGPALGGRKGDCKCVCVWGDRRGAPGASSRELADHAEQQHVCGRIDYLCRL
jgi:hypothetical protein